MRLRVSTGLLRCRVRHQAGGVTTTTVTRSPLQRSDEDPMVFSGNTSEQHHL